MALPPVEEERLSKGLLIAAIDGNLPKMKEFAEGLDHGQGLLDTYSKYRGPEGYTALIHAIVACSHPTVAYLITKGANVNLPNHEGYTPVHTAAHQGLKEILQLLISNGGDVEALCKGITPLCNAASQGKNEAVKVLLDNNANPNATSVNSFSPLMLSIAAGSHECINLLLKAGADPDLGVNGLTPLLLKL